MIGAGAETCHQRSSSQDSDNTIASHPEDHRALLKEISDVRLIALKISNISWDLSSSDVVEFLAAVRLERQHVHIPIDRTTGKTKADMFVELGSVIDAVKCIAMYNRRILKGRVVTLTLSSLEELFRVHFPSFDVDAGPNQGDFGQELLSAAECASLIAICRNYKAHFSRKCAERPFEHVMSILRLAPWHQIDHPMVDRLHGVVGGALEALSGHLSRSGTTSIFSCGSATSPAMVAKKLFGSLEDCSLSSQSQGNSVSSSSQLTSDLLERLMACSMNFPAFDSQQKIAIREASEDKSSKVKFGHPMPLAIEPKPARHLRRSSIDRILDELGRHEKRTDAVDRLMKDAFDHIMLSHSPDQ